MHLIDKSYSLPHPRAMVFDWDNTLVDSWGLIHQSLNYVFESFGMPLWTLAETKIRIHRSMKDTLPKYFPDNWEEVAKIYRDHYASICGGLKPLEYAEKTLQIAQSKKIPMGIVTNKRNYLMHTELNALGWGKYFSVTVGSGDLEEDKPSPVGVKFVLDKIGRELDDQVWFIGDSVSDMETAYNCGCAPVFFGEDDYLSDRYKKCRPKVHFPDHRAFCNYLESI